MPREDGPQRPRTPRGLAFCYTASMISLNGILIGAGVVIAGVLFVRFAFQIQNFTGAQFWLERFTGSGTTTGLYKIFGVLLVIGGFLIATGFGNDILATLLSPFRSSFHPISQ